MKDVLKTLGVYGWSAIEHLVLAGYVGKVPILFVGPSGVAKTYAIERLGHALSQARDLRGEKPFVSKYRNAATAAPEDLVGIAVPPSGHEMAQMPKDHVPQMRLCASPDTIQNASQLAIDEINRTSLYTQNKFFSILSERRIDGVDLENLDYVFGAMNPLNLYEGTEPLDRAFAERFALFITPPSFKTMSKEEKQRVISARLQRSGANTYGSDAVQYGHALTPQMCLEVDDFITRCQKKHRAMVRSVGESVTDYVRCVIDELNNSTSSGAQIQADIEGRRAGMLAEAIIAVHVVQKERGRGKLQTDALDVLKHCWPNAVVGDKEYTDTKLSAIHDNYKDLLQSRQDKIEIEIRQQPSEELKIAKAFELDAPESTITDTIQDAHNALWSRDELQARAMSLALFNVLQDAPAYQQEKVGKYVLDELGQDVRSIMENADPVEFLNQAVTPGFDVSTEMTKLLKLYLPLRGNSVGRAAINLGAIMLREEKDDAATLAGESDSKRIDTIRDLRSNISTALQALKKYIKAFRSINNVPSAA